MITTIKNEKSIIKLLLIVPFVLIIFFTIIGYGIISFIVIPENNTAWKEEITKDYYNEQIKNIEEEAIKIYSLIKNERVEYKRIFKRYLKQQNDTFTAVTKKGITYQITDTSLNFKVMSIKQFEEQYPDLFFETKAGGIEGSIEWNEKGIEYLGYYRFCEHNFYITYIEKSKQIEKDRKNILDKVMGMTFAKDSYIFAIGYDNLIYAHKNKDLLMNEFLEQQFPQRYKTVTYLSEYAKKNKKGIVEYQIETENGSGILEDKIAYMIADDEWGLAFGFGLLKKDITRIIEKENEIKKKLVDNILGNLTLVAIFYLVATMLAMYFIGKLAVKKMLIQKDIALFEKEKNISLANEQGRYLNLKESIIDELVPLAILDKNLKFQMCSQRFATLFETTLQDIKGESLYAILNGNCGTSNEHYKTNCKVHRDTCESDINLFINGKRNELTIKEKPFKTLKGNIVWLTITIKKEEKEDYIAESYRYTILCQEVEEKLSLMTEVLKEQEKNLIQEQIILQQSKLTAIGTTVDSIAHQWKQPLAVVMGELALLLIKIRLEKTQNDEIAISAIKPGIEKIEDTIVLLSETVETFNTFYDAVEENNQIDITRLVKDTFKIMIPSTSANLYKISYDIEDEVYAFGSKGLYQQVLLTLIHNAIEAFRDKNIKDRQFYITIKNEGENNVCTIEDNAGGIREEIIDKIFDLNFSTKKKNKIGNSGLGLFLANIVLKDKFENGKISVKNTKRGAMFTIVTKNIKIEN